MCGHATINRLYRLVWSEVQGAWVAVAENTRGRGKRSARRSLAAALFAGVPALTTAATPPPTQLPTGGTVAAGNLNIAQNGGRMAITQTTQRGVVDWQTFNVGSAAQVEFLQPSVSAVTLNRVLDTQASQIFGRIVANGQVFLSNPNGVYFSPSASVDVGGLVATTHTIGADEFMAGSTTFRRASGNTSGSVVNEGNLQASLNGYIALLAPEVRNSGFVLAQAGTVALVAGEAIELKFENSHSLTGVLVSPSSIATLVENGAAVRAPGGLIIMSAQAARSLNSGVVRNTGNLEATGFGVRGGKIVLDASGLVDNSGSLDVSGQSGGNITVTGDRMLSAGTMRADGIQAGGAIVTSVANGLVETNGAFVSANGDRGNISINASAGQLFSSGRYHADGLGPGQRGGQIALSGVSVVLRGTSASADGDAGGGTVLVGGDLHGANPSVHNAQDTSVGTGVTLSANALTRGDGGKVVVWSDQNTSFAGAVSAIGGAAGGNGGTLEVSGKHDLHFSGMGDAHAPKGTAGQLLLDPKNIFIDNDESSQQEFINPHQTVGGTFGASTTQLTSTSGSTVTSTGYAVVTDPTDNLGAANGGAAYLFRQSDQALISTLYGTHVGDRLGNNDDGIPVRTLTNGNFVVSSAHWNGGQGAVTWGSGTTGWGNGAMAASSANSLVGTLTTDAVGSKDQVMPLPNGNYLVANELWGFGAGALTWGNGGTGTSGLIGSSNSLVGSTAYSQATNGSIAYKYGDRVGKEVHILPNGNYVMVASAWDMGVGAVAFGSGSGGLVGVLSASNALTGTTSRSDPTGYGNNTDKVGQNFLALSGSKFVVYGSDWNGNSGAMTWFDGSAAVTGVVSAGNSLVGSANDFLTGGGITTLGSNNAYVISSPQWSANKGAATWVSYATDVKSVAISTSGLVGANAGDTVSSKSVTVLGNHDYVIASPNWNGGFGAATLVDGSTGKAKVDAGTTINSTNSIVGTHTTDNIASNGVIPLLGNGNYVVLSPTWTNGANANAGSVTWSSGGTPTVGAVSTANSLVGSSTNDLVGSYKYNAYNNGNATPIPNTGATVTALTNGNVAIASPMWNGTRGAVTWMDGATGTTTDATHVVSANNSIVGSNVLDFVGAVAYHVVPSSPGVAYDVLSSGLTALAGGNFVVESSYWKNGAVTKAGALTWSGGASAPTVGPLTSSNSLVGSSSGDFDGVYTSVIPLLAGVDGNGFQQNSGNYLLRTAGFDSGGIADAGALTWGSGSAALTGTISNANSLVGLKSNDVYNWTIAPLPVNGNFVVLNPAWDNGAATGAGAATWVNGATGRLSNYVAAGNKNIVSAANSLVGTQANDAVGGYIDLLFTGRNATTSTDYSTGNYVVFSTNWSNGALAGAGALTWGSGTAGVSGAITRGNSIVGEKAGDSFGYNYSKLSNGNYVVANPNLDVNGIVNAGAASWVDGNTGRLSDYVARGSQNFMSAANSMVGSHPNDAVGSALYSRYVLSPIDYSNPGYFIASYAWNCFAGAFTYIADASGPTIGTVGAANSAVGNPNASSSGGMDYSPNISLGPDNSLYVPFTGGGGRVVLTPSTMPAPPSIALAGATNFGDAQSQNQDLSPDYVAGVLKTGTNLTLQANNDIYVKGAINATGGTGGGTLTMQAGRSIAIVGDIVTGNRDLVIIANETIANGVGDAYRDDGIATISMGKTLLGANAVINAGTGNVSLSMSAGADKSFHNAGSIAINSITGGTIKVINAGNGAGASSDLPDLSMSCCGFDLGYRAAGADTVLNLGATLNASGAGSAVQIAAAGNFQNLSGNGATTIALGDPSARWLIYSSSPTGSSFGNLNSQNSAVWHSTYSNGASVSQTGNRYLFALQPTVTVGTQNASKVYGTDLSSGNSLADLTISLSGVQTGVSGAFSGDTLTTAISGTVVASSSGAAARANVNGSPYSITFDLSGATGNNGYAVQLGSNTARILTVTPKALGVAFNGVSKVYDGATGATVSNSDFALTGIVGGDSINVTKSSATFNTADAATANTITTPLTGADFTGTNGTSMGNYTLPASASGAGTITPKAISASLVGVSKTYDGNATATLGTSNYSLTGLVGSQSFSVGQTNGTYNSADVVGANTVNASLSSGEFTPGGGALPSNYILPVSASGSASITPRGLTLSLTGNLDRSYDGLASATLAANNFALSGLISGETATVTKTSGNYNHAAVATATSISTTLVTGDYSAGPNTTLSNYTLPTTASASASITRAPLTVTANNLIRAYDGNQFTGGNGVSYSGFVNSETTSALGGTVSYGGTAQHAANAGAYTIVPTGYTAANYAVTYVNGTLTINPIPLVVVTGSIVGNPSRAYNSLTSLTLDSGNYSLSGFANGDSATITKTTGTFDSPNAGSRTVTVSLSGSDFSAVGVTQLSNYTLPVSVSGPGTITQKTLNITLAGSIAKSYDGNTTAALIANNYTLTGFIGSQSANVTKTSGTYNSADVAAATGVTATLAAGDYAAANGTILANYALPTTVSGAANITAKVLSASLTGNLSRPYDGGTAFTLAPSNYVLSGFVGSESAAVGQTAGNFNSANVVGANSLTAILASGDFSAVNGASLSNYVLPTSASASSSITPRTLSGVLTGTIAKVYDTNSTATLGGANYSLTGFVNGESATVTHPSGIYNSPNVATATSVSVTLVPNDFSAGNNTILSNYVVPTTISGAASINAAPLTASLTGTTTKVYDGNDSVTINPGNFALSGFVGGQSGAITQAAARYDSPNVLGAHSVLATIISGSFLPGTGTSLSNYSLPDSVSGAGAITPRPLGVTLAASVSKLYDGNTLATISPSSYVLSGLVGGQSVSVNQTSGVYNSSTVTGATSVAIALDASAFSPGGGTVLSNYVLPTGLSGPASISPAPLTVTARNSAKIFDNLAFNGGNGVTYSGFVSNDSSASLDGTLAFIGSAQGALNAGSYTITPGGLRDANYAIAYVAGTLEISRAPLSANAVAIVGNPTKVYDGTTSAALTPANFSLTGFAAGNGASIVQRLGSYDSRNVGAPIVSVSLGETDFVPTFGTLMSNYILPQSASGIGAITARPVTLIAPAVSKTYDGSLGYSVTASDLTALSAALLGSDKVTAASIAYADKNAGNANRSVSLAGVVLDDGNRGANYQVAFAGNSDSTIAPRSLSVGASGVTRTYDAGVAAVVALSDNRLSGDQITVTNTSANFADKNAGAGKTITVDGIGLTGADAGNYVIKNQSVQTTASIMPRALQVGGVSVEAKPFDGGVVATLNGTPTVNSLAGDSVKVAGTPVANFVDAAVGTNKPVSVNGYTVVGADAGNYALAQPSGLVAAIIQAPPQVPAPVIMVPTPLPAPVVATLTPPMVASIPSIPITSTPAPSTTTAPNTPAASNGSGSPSGSGAGAGTGSNISAAATPTTTRGVLVSLVKEASVQQNGVIAVSIPKDLATAGTGFSFPLPAQIVEGGATEALVTATTMAGTALPSWITYDASSKSFIATAVPDGALPIQVQVMVGEKRAIVVISERADR